MGHVRLGKLSKSRPWREVIDLLDAPTVSAPAVAAALVDAGQDRLRQLRGDPSLAYSYWLLTRIAAASRSSDFDAAVRQFGLTAPPGTPVLSFLAQVISKLRERTAGFIDSGNSRELSLLAFQRALSETVGEYSPNFFRSSVEDLQAAFRSYSTTTRFGVLAHRFFTDYFARTLQGLVDRELALHAGPDFAIANIDQGNEFLSALDLYARQSARIMQEFAEDWYSKYTWQTAGRITQQQAQSFVAVALRKLSDELKTGDIKA